MGPSVQLAKAIHDAAARDATIICLGRLGITADIAPRLGRCFGADPQGLINMQSRYDLKVQAEQLAAQLAAVEPRSAA